MEKKQNKVVAYIKKNKDIIIIGAVSCILGGTIAWGLEKHWLNTEYGKLFKVIREFGVDQTTGRTFTNNLTHFLDGAKSQVLPCEVLEGATKTLADLGDLGVAVCDIRGIEATTEISGVLIGLK